MPDHRHQCELCLRHVNRVTKHHLVPKSRIKKRRRRGQKEQTPEFAEVIARLCSPCHRMIHAVLSERELERDYDSIESLQAHEEIASFLDWIRKQGDGPVRVRWTNKRKENANARRRKR